jgi:hypothetical protein
MRYAGIVVATALMTITALAAADPVSAAPCAAGTLQSYFALGAGGCTIGGNTLADFALLPLLIPATQIDPALVTVTPVAGGSEFGLDFGLDQVATDGNLFDIRFVYDVFGASYSGASVGLVGSDVVPDGANTAIMRVCRGAAFSGETCAKPDATIIAFDIGVDASVLESASFAPVGPLGVIGDIGVDAGVEGTASLTGVTHRFATAVVPEPPSFMLLGLGLSALRFATKRRRSRSASLSA